MLIFAPLRRPPIALMWSGLALAAIGDQLYYVAVTWLAVGLVGEKSGYVSALQSAAILLSALFGGIWADGWDHRRTMIGADLLRAAILVALVIAGTLAPPLGISGLAAAAIVVAALQAFFRPALQASLPRVARDSALLPATNGLFDATERIARLVGPTLAGALSGIVPILHFFTLNAAAFLASAAALSLLRRVLPRRKTGEADGGLRQVLSRLARGLHALRRQPMLAYVMAICGILNGAWFLVMFLGVPLIVERHGLKAFGGTGLGAFALVMASYGITNLAGNLVVGSMRLRRPASLIFTGNLCLGGGLALMGIAEWLVPTPYLLPALMAAAGFAAIGGPMQDIPVATLRQIRFAADEIPAVVRLFMVSTHIGTLAAMLAAPRLVAALGTAAVVVGCGTVIIAVGLVGLARFRGEERRTGAELARSHPL